MIQTAQLNPIASPVKVITDGFIETPKKNPNMEYFFNELNNKYPLILVTIKVFEILDKNFNAFVKS